ncbi:MAG: C45 family peptidase [Thermoplasmata archaeon]|nr:C45 family peptidase [Thermoplasmata archaeon]
MNGSTKKVAAVAVVAAVVIVAAAAVMLNNNGSHDSGNGVTVTWTDDEKLFYIDVDFDYKFDEYLTTGSKTMADFYTYLENNVTNGTKITGASGNTGCSTFTATDEDGDLLMARNFDFRDCKAAVVHTDPEDGYESLSIVDLTMFSYTSGDTPTTLTGNDALRAVAYIPLDGVNEMGVSVSINSVNNAAYGSMDNGKTAIFMTSALRLILDNAATTEEAVDLIMDYDLIMTHFHIMISDASGNSVAVEVNGNDYYVTETPLLTNHYVSADLKDVLKVNESSQNRYDTIQTTLTSTGGVMSTGECMDLLETVLQDEGISHQTKWSVVYNKTEGTMTLCLLMDYATEYSFSLSSSDAGDTATTTAGALVACEA